MGRAIKNADSTVTLECLRIILYLYIHRENCVVYLKTIHPTPAIITISILNWTASMWAVKKWMCGWLRPISSGGGKRYTAYTGDQQSHRSCQRPGDHYKNWSREIKHPTTKFKTKLSLLVIPLLRGFGNDMEIPCGNGSKWYDQHNAYWSYAPRTARHWMLVMISAISGAGIYHNWNNDGPTVPRNTKMRFLNTDGSNKMEFQRFCSGYVTIALGTNDLSNGDGKNARKPFDKTVFISIWKLHQNHLQSLPQAQLLMNSPMVNGERDILLKKV